MMDGPAAKSINVEDLKRFPVTIASHSGVPQQRDEGESLLLAPATAATAHARGGGGSQNEGNSLGGGVETRMNGKERKRTMERTNTFLDEDEEEEELSGGASSSSSSSSGKDSNGNSSDSSKKSGGEESRKRIKLPLASTQEEGTEGLAAACVGSSKHRRTGYNGDRNEDQIYMLRTHVNDEEAFFAAVYDGRKSLSLSLSLVNPTRD